jgi:hypothetical protein
MVQSSDCAVRVIHYPTNTSAIAVGWYSRGGFKPLLSRVIRTLKVRITMAKKAIWSNKLVRTYQGNIIKETFIQGVFLQGPMDENEFDLDEILRKGR